VHGMEGFDYERARKELQIPEEFEVEAMAAVGKPGPKESLPEKLQARESPNDRRLRLRVGPSNWRRSRPPILWQGLRRCKKTFELELQAGLRAVRDTESKKKLAPVFFRNSAACA
jgi:hypothetical protein